MKVPTFQLKEVESPLSRLRKRLDAWTARKQAEAKERERKEMEAAAAAAAALAAAASPHPIGGASDVDSELAALHDRLAILENAWNAFHQAAGSPSTGPQLAVERLNDRITALETARSPEAGGALGELLARFEDRLRTIEGQYVSVDVVTDESAKLQKLVLDLGVGALRQEMAKLRAASDAKKPVPGDGEVASLKKQLEALKLKVAASEASEQATRAGLVALQEKQDADEADLKSLRKELEMEVVAAPK